MRAANDEKLVSLKLGGRVTSDTADRAWSFSGPRHGVTHRRDHEAEGYDSEHEY
jgi:hypothetical protein